MTPGTEPRKQHSRVGGGCMFVCLGAHTCKENRKQFFESNT